MDKKDNLNKKEENEILEESHFDKEDIRYTFEDYTSGKVLRLFKYQIDMITKGMREKYKNLIYKYGMFNFNISKDDNNYYFHIIIPSESLKKMSYDTIIQLTKPTAEETDLNKYYIKVFSNSPSFTFTFAYAINDAGMLVDGTASKISKEALVTPPTIRNPGLMLGFEKFIFMACEFLKENNMLNSDELDKDFAKLFVPYAKVLRSIPDDETKLKEYQIRNKNKTKEEKYLDRKTRVKNNRTSTTSSSAVRSKNIKNEIKSREEHKEKVARAKANNNQKFTNGTKSKIKGSKLKPKRKIGR